LKKFLLTIKSNGINSEDKNFTKDHLSFLI